MSDASPLPVSPLPLPLSSVIDFARLEREQAQFAQRWRMASPFEHIVIDDFADPGAMRTIESAFPDPAELNKSRDYIFAREKYEKNQFSSLHPLMAQMNLELLSDRFRAWINGVTGIDLFVDPEFLGGGLHSGGVGSFLDMHADFNIHPLHADWLREINILIYLNHGWQPSWGGSLKLRHLETGVAGAIEPLFNRCVIMLTKEHTLHGYDPISFPPGRYRRSIAGYGYSLIDAQMGVKPRSTVWRSDQSMLRRAAGPITLRLVRIKNILFGTGSVRNR